ncbi:MAG: asparaginase, partial [Planctomycetota bacterium]
AGAARMFEAIQKAPHFLAGRARFDTALLRARPGRFLVKCGAEGCFGIGVRPPLGPLGIAVKIDDGTPRGYETFLARFLVKLGLLEGSEASLATFLAGKVHNTRGHEVGEIRTAMD